MSSPKALHLQAASKVLKYLKKTPGQGLSLSANSKLRLKTSVMLNGKHVQTLEGLYQGYVSSLVIL